jgi:formimidoylglutamate deiminase
VSPVEELRWLEYGQRLLSRRRNIAATPAQPSVSDTLLHAVQASAATATGFDADALAKDAFTLDAAHPIFAGCAAALTANSDTAGIADRWIFSGNRPLIDTVEVAGDVLVRGGAHRARETVAAGFAKAMRQLT